MPSQQSMTLELTEYDNASRDVHTSATTITEAWGQVQQVPNMFDMAAAAREQTRIYAEYIAHLWETDPQTRAEIQQGIDEMNAGEGELFDIDRWLQERRAK